MDINTIKHKISIITVCYNAEDTIEATILSVIGQTYSNIEFLIIDGASSDNTLKILERYKDKVSLLVSAHDKGIYDAMNKGISYASGDFVFFLNSGDKFFDKDVVLSVVSQMSESDVVYYGDVFLVPQRLRFGGQYDKYKLAMGNICHQSIFYPKLVFKKYHYDIKYKLYADWFLNIQCMSDKDVKFTYLNLVICYYDTTGLSNRIDDSCFWKDYTKHVVCYLGYETLIYVRVRKFLQKKKKSVLLCLKKLSSIIRR